jgi:hypothetical protein
MKNLFIIPLVLMSLVSFPSWGETMDDLIERDNVYYKKFSDVPFTGKVTGETQGYLNKGIKIDWWEEYWPNGQLKTKVWFKNGKREGSFVMYWDTGQLGSKGNYKNGKQEDTWVNFASDGSVNEELTGTFRNDVKVSN